MVLVLTVTAVSVGALLAGFFQLVAPRIEANRLAEEKRAIFAVLEKARSYEIHDIEVDIDGSIELVRIFRGLDRPDGEGGEGGAEEVGFAFLAEGPGFSAMIRMMVGLNIDRETLSGLEVVEQIETPGLGDKIAKDKFEGQFRALRIKPRIEYIKNRKPEKDNQIMAITGATISSRAVVNAINKRLEAVLKALETFSSGPMVPGEEPVEEPLIEREIEIDDG
jgi:electron transport complex protein RnfG